MRILEIPLSTYYDSFKNNGPTQKWGQEAPGYSLNLAGEKVPDKAIVEELKAYREDSFFKVEGGSKVLSKYLRRDHGFIVNHKKVARLARENGLLLKKAKKKKTKFRKTSINHEVIRENQVWEFDIKYCYLHGEKKYFFFLAFIDVYTRQIKGWYCGYRCQAKDLLATLNFALFQNLTGVDDLIILRSDNGTQMRSHQFLEGILNLPVDHEFIPVSTPNKNAHIESFFSIFDKHLQLQYFYNFQDAYQWTLEFIDFYNVERIHGSLGMSPLEFSKQKGLHGMEKFTQAI